MDRVRGKRLLCQETSGDAGSNETFEELETILKRHRYFVRKFMRLRGISRK